MSAFRDFIDIFTRCVAGAYILLMLALSTAGQTAAPSTPACDHISNRRERFENIRILPPARIISFDGKRVEAVYEDARGITAVILAVDGRSVIDLPKDAKRLVWILFCIKDHAQTGDTHIYYVYVVSPVLDKQFLTHK